MFGSAPANRTCLTPFPTVGRGSRIRYWKRLSAWYRCQTAALCRKTCWHYWMCRCWRRGLTSPKKGCVIAASGSTNPAFVRGIDDDNVRELELPTTGQHTWRFGLTRMLLGYAMESAQGEWQSVLPYDESSGLIAELVGHLASLLMQLNIWRRGLAQERPLEKWLPVCRDMLNAFFLPDAETEAAMTLIEQQWQAIIAEGLGAQYGDAVPLSLLRDELAQRLE
ncbi:hypothetical protein ACLK11_16170 [Escherichia coli]